jgi:hypothetical protein
MSITTSWGSQGARGGAGGDGAQAGKTHVWNGRRTNVPGAILIGYRDDSGILLSLDRTQWPHVPEGNKLVIQ